MMNWLSISRTLSLKTYRIQPKFWSFSLTLRLSIDENPNCEMADPRVFQERSEPQPVSAVLRQRGDKDVWCPIISWDEQGPGGPAWARKVDDSGDGTCYLVYGGRWGLRLKDPACEHAWGAQDPDQWGEPFLLLPSDGADLRFGIK